jgi:site-specific DNA-cytosine methylase
MQELINTLSIAERDPVRQRYLVADCRANRPQTCIHQSVFDVANGGGACSAHGAPCLIRRLTQIDFIVFGPPCEPYSSKRTSTVDSSEDHKSFDTLWEDTYKFLSTYLPRGGVMEEVSGFMRKNKLTGESYCDKWVAALQAIGYHVAIRKMNANVWFKVPRDRRPLTSYNCG